MLGNSMSPTSRLDLLNPDFVEAFDRLTLLTTKLLDTPVSVFSVVDVENDRQYFKSFKGLPEPWAGKRETPLSHSFCQHVRYFSRPLIVEDAREHDVLRHNLAIRDIGVIAYLGFPVFDEANEAIGSLCAIDSKPRAWSEDQIEVMRSLTATLNEILKQQAETEAQKNEVSRLQESLDKSEATLKNREQFFAFLCHELRTPLSGIIGGVRLAEHSFERNDEAKRPEIGKMLKIIGSSAQSMKQTVDEILDLSKLESDMFDINPAVFNLRELADDIIGQHGSAAEGKGISLEIDWNLSDGLEKRFGAHHRIGQLLQNLLSNAIRFTDEGSVTLSISGDEKGLRIQVIDTGEGMTEEQLDRLFCNHPARDAVKLR
jgi:signal transduction histidine kinase